MGNIPVDPAITAAATVVSTQVGFVPLNLCKPAPASEGLRCLSLQINGGNSPNGIGFVDLSTSFTGTPPISQLCAMYVDASESIEDVSIIFADTGYKVTVKSGNAKLFPVISGNLLPQFYVVGTFVNIFCLNQFIPEFDTEIFGNAILYGKSFFTPNSTVQMPGQSFSQCSEIDLTTSFQTITPLLDGDIMCVTGLIIDLLAQATTDPVNAIITVATSSAGNVILQRPITISPSLSIINFVNAPYIFNLTPTGSSTSVKIKVASLVGLTQLTAFCNVYVGAISR